MFVIVKHGCRPRADYTHASVASENVRDPEEEVVEVSDDMDTRTVVWDAGRRKWNNVDAILSPVEQRRQSGDYRVRRGQAYADLLDTGVITEVLLDIALELAADPGLRSRLRQSTRDKLDGISAAIDAVKTAHPKL